MKITRKKIIWSVIILAVVALIGVSATRKPQVAYETEKVVRGAVVEEVSVTGSLSPTRKISLEPEASGKVTKLHVESGAEVKAGDVLAELDARDIQSRIASAAAAVASARARLNELAAGATPQELAVAQAAVDTAVSRRDSAVAAKADAETALANAKSKAETLSSGKLQSLLLSYDKAVTDVKDALTRSTGAMFTVVDNQLTFGTTSGIHEVNAKNSRLAASAQADAMTVAVSNVKAAGTSEAALAAYPSVSAALAMVKSHLEDMRAVLDYASGLPSSTLAEYRSSVGSALAALDSTGRSMDAEKSSLDLQFRLNQAELASAQSGLTAATYAVETAERSLTQSKADLTLKQTGTRTEVIASQRAQVEVQEAALSGYYTELSKRRIVAPIDGIVTDVPVEIGETVSPGKPAVTMQTKGNFEIVTNISEIDIGKVQVGDTVGITLDAFPRTETWTGKVVKIDPAEKVVEGVIFYETTVVFDVEDLRLRSGMTANLTVETDRKDDVLRVPLRGLREADGKATVRVLREGAAVDVDVTVGLQNNTHAELVGGLAEGDEVIVGEIKK